MKKIRMVIKELKPSRIKTFYDLVLVEQKGIRALNIALGKNEADNMAVFMDNINLPRPLTYETFVQVLTAFNINLTEVKINNFIDGTYYAKATFKSEDKKFNFDLRPSDAVNLALRFNCPIFATEQVLQQAGFEYKNYFRENITAPQQQITEDIDNLSVFGLNMLTDLLKDAVEKEDYLTASILRDKIKALKNDFES